MLTITWSLAYIESTTTKHAGKLLAIFIASATGGQFAFSFRAAAAAPAAIVVRRRWLGSINGLPTSSSSNRRWRLPWRKIPAAGAAHPPKDKGEGSLEGRHAVRIRHTLLAA